MSLDDIEVEPLTLKNDIFTIIANNSEFFRSAVTGKNGKPREETRFSSIIRTCVFDSAVGSEKRKIEGREGEKTWRELSDGGWARWLFKCP